MTKDTGFTQTPDLVVRVVHRCGTFVVGEIVAFAGTYAFTADCQEGAWRVHTFVPWRATLTPAARAAILEAIRETPADRIRRQQDQAAEAVEA